jgi:predicted nucleic acid-binding protein
MIHLDTGFLIRALVRDSAEDRRLRGWLEGEEPIGVSAIAWAEFLCGPLTAGEQALAARVVGEPVPLEAADARLAAALFNGSGRRRGTLADCMIAAAAVRAGAQLATTDPKGYAPLVAQGLRLA